MGNLSGRRAARLRVVVDTIHNISEASHGEGATECNLENPRRQQPGEESSYQQRLVLGKAQIFAVNVFSLYVW